MNSPSPELPKPLLEEVNERTLKEQISSGCLAERTAVAGLHNN